MGADTGHMGSGGLDGICMNKAKMKRCYLQGYRGPITMPQVAHAYSTMGRHRGGPHIGTAQGLLLWDAGIR